MSAEAPAARGQLAPPVRHVEYGLLVGMLGIAAAAALLWTLLSGSSLVAAPLPTLGLLYQGLVGEGWMWPHIGATFRPIILGFMLALVIGVGAGILLGRSPYWRQVFEPVLLSLYSIPKITLYPVFLLLFGTGIESRIIMALIHAVFPLLINSMIGVSATNPSHLKVARMAQAKPWQVVTKVYLPSMAPALVAGVRMGFSLAIIGVVLSELFAAKEGLGFLIMRSYGVLNVERMLAIILFLFIVAVIVNMSLRADSKSPRPCSRNHLIASERFWARGGSAEGPGAGPSRILAKPSSGPRQEGGRDPDYWRDGLHWIAHGPAAAGRGRGRRHHPVPYAARAGLHQR